MAEIGDADAARGLRRLRAHASRHSRPSPEEGLAVRRWLVASKPHDPANIEKALECLHRFDAALIRGADARTLRVVRLELQAAIDRISRGFEQRMPTRAANHC